MIRDYKRNHQAYISNIQKTKVGLMKNAAMKIEKQMLCYE